MAPSFVYPLPTASDRKDCSARGSAAHDTRAGHRHCYQRNVGATCASRLQFLPETMATTDPTQAALTTREIARINTLAIPPAYEDVWI